MEENERKEEEEEGVEEEINGKRHIKENGGNRNNTQLA